MPKISDETIRLMEELYAQNLPIAEIAKMAGISYSTAYGRTRLRQRINPETGERFESIVQYMDYRARQMINPETGERFESINQHNEFTVRQRINPETGEPFESVNQYNEYTTRQRVNPETGERFESKKQYEEFTVRQRINPETGERFESRNQYEMYMARKRIVNPETGKPFESIVQHMNYRVRQRQERQANQKLSGLIRTRLKELGKNQVWLAREIGVTHQAVSLYARRKSVPKEDLLERMFSSLDVPYKTLDDLLEDTSINLSD